MQLLPDSFVFNFVKGNIILHASTIETLVVIGDGLGNNRKYDQQENHYNDSRVENGEPMSGCAQKVHVEVGIETIFVAVFVFLIPRHRKLEG